MKTLCSMNLRFLTGLLALTTFQAIGQIGLPPASSQGAKGGQAKAKTNSNGYSQEQLNQKAQETLDRKNEATEQRSAKSPSTRTPQKKTIQKAESKKQTNFGEHPKLVVGITVDQMRMDYL
ncbi:MAG: hypothetical protein ISQ97_04785, partial [Flavobacteriales bacterium]|nr:hypothetical protein [Flavobacteriales bacterium]